MRRCTVSRSRFSRVAEGETPATIDTFDDAESGEALAARLREVEALRTLFARCYFFLGREVPKESLAFVIRSAGGAVSWSGCPDAPYDERSALITHVIMDRPLSVVDVTK